MLDKLEAIKARFDQLGVVVGNRAGYRIAQAFGNRAAQIAAIAFDTFEIGGIAAHVGYLKKNNQILCRADLGRPLKILPVCHPGEGKDPWFSTNCWS